MKKGIVMEQHRKFTIVMTHDGLFEKAHPIDAEIGFEVNYEPFVQKNGFLIFKDKFLTMRVAAWTCVFLIALLPLYMAMDKNEAYAYVDININPSIELEIDNDLNVSDIIPYNEDAKLLIADIGDIKGKEVEEAIEIIMSKSEEKGLINAAKNVLIGVYFLDEDENNPVMEVIEKHFAKKTTDWQVVTVSIPEEVRDTAKENQESMNEALAKTVASQPTEQVKAIVTEEENKVLQSFFNKDKTETEVTNEDSKEENRKSEEPSIAKDKHNEKGNSNRDGIHPSELKGKNGEINSGKNKNSEQNGKAKGQNNHQHKNWDKSEHHKPKPNHGHGKNKNKNSDHDQKGYHKENGNQGKYNNGKGKGHEKGNNGNSGKGNNGNKEKGNNGNNGKGNNKHDDFSFGIPYYR